MISTSVSRVWVDRPCRYTALVARKSPLPPSLAGKSDREDVLADVESARGTTMEQRALILISLCRMAAEQIAQHRDPRRALDWQDRVSVDAERLLERLRAAHRPRG